MPTFPQICLLGYSILNSLTWLRGDKEFWAFTGLEDGWRMEGARWETVNDGSSAGGGRGTKTEGVVDRKCHWKGPESLGQDEGGRRDEGA